MNTDPDPVSPERLDPDPEPVNIRPDPKPWIIDPPHFSSIFPATNVNPDGAELFVASVNRDYKP